MKEEANPKTYFWAYDIFGYLLPGLVLLVVYSAVNDQISGYALSLWDGPIQNILLLVLLAYTAGHVVAAISSFVLEKVVLSNWLRYPTEHMFSSDRETRRGRNLLLPSYFRPYSPQFQERVRQTFEREFAMVADDPHDLFWLAWSHNSINHPAAYRRGTHFLDLYGFSRNLCMTILLVAFAPLVPGWISPIHGLAWVLVCISTAYMMFVSYTKLLRRLNDEVYRGFVASTAPPRTRTEATG